MMPHAGHVAIHGRGVAAACCAHLLKAAGVPVSITHPSQVRVPAILVSFATQMLMRDVFQKESLFDDMPRIDRRIVSWGSNREPAALPHAAVVISENTLLDRLHVEPSGHTEGDAEWALFASRPLPESVLELPFGSRKATAAAAILKASQTTACWVESLASGWLFLIPGWLIAVGGAPEALLASEPVGCTADRCVNRRSLGISGIPSHCGSARRARASHLRSRSHGFRPYLRRWNRQRCA